jgi:hypothetical protein
MHNSKSNYISKNLILHLKYYKINLKLLRINLTLLKINPKFVKKLLIQQNNIQIMEHNNKIRLTYYHQNRILFNKKINILTNNNSPIINLLDKKCNKHQTTQD